MKKKVLRHRGAVQMEPRQDRDGEWLTVTFHRSRGPFVVVELLGQQAANIYLRSAKKRDKGKVLFRLEGIWLPGNTRRIVEALLTTFDEAAYTRESHIAIDRVWRAAGCHAV